MMRHKKNKRGQWSTSMKIILALLVLVVSIIIYSRVSKGSVVVLQCTKQGGECVTGTCDMFTQITTLSDTGAGCKKGELCCINITRSVKEDPYCKDKIFGSRCREEDSPLYYCDPAKTCISRCEFCAKNWGTAEAQQICGKDYNKFKNNNDPKQTEQWSCSCNRTECSPALIKAGNCTEGYCPSSNPETYCCITSAAK